MNLLLATVEHSGTRQILRLFNWNNCSIADEETPVNHPHTVHFEHLTDNCMDEILSAQKRMTVITSGRPAEDIAVSWINRGKDLSELARQLTNRERIIERGAYVINLGSDPDRQPEAS